MDNLPFNMKITIVGGGIAGLTTAIALNKIGIEVSIFEASPEIKALGACQAIEDAVVLADEIKQNATIEAAFKAFEKRRLKRTHYVVNTSWTLGKVAQSENRLLADLRNFVFRLIPKRMITNQLEKIYDVDF